jgi:hypothetical protein
MRRSILPISIALIICLSAGLLAAWVFFGRERHFRKVDIPVAWLETIDTSRFSVQPIRLDRSFPDDSVLVFLPGENSRGQIYLYDQKNYQRLLYGDHHAIPLSQPNAAGYAALFGQPVLNLSNFATGKYYVHVTSCNYAGFLQIELVDKVQ